MNRHDGAAAMANVPARVRSPGTLLAYGGMTLPLTLAELPILLYLPAFYAQELHLKAALVGVVFLAARLWDGLSDLLVGWLSDRTASRFGRRKPWVLLGAPFLIGSTWLLCNPPQDSGLPYLVLWAAVFYTAFTAVKIPHLSWGTELATDYVERSRVTAFRETFTILGNLAFVLAPLLLLAEKAPLRNVLFLVAVMMLWLTPLAALPIAFVPDVAPTHARSAPLLKGLLAPLKDRAFVYLALATLFAQLNNGMINSLAVFAFDVGLQLPDKIFWTILVLYVTTLASLPFTMWVSRRVEKHRLLALCVSLNAIAVGALIWVPMANFTVVASLWVLAGLGAAGMFFLPTSMLADIIDRDEVVRGERRSGAYVAVYNLLFKIGLALGVGSAFGLLEFVHFDPAATQHDPRDASNIRLLAFGLPSLCLCIAVGFYLKHPITRQAQQALRNRLDARPKTDAYREQVPTGEVASS